MRRPRRHAVRGLLRRPSRRFPVAVLALVAALVAGTSLSTTSATAARPDPATPQTAGPVPGDDWVVDTPESHGIDAARLDEARTYAFAEGRNTQGVVVVHEGAIVAEWYSAGAGPESWAASWSVAKSFASALVGIALDEGLIPSIDVPMTSYFPEWSGTPLESITLRHVLHMESGRDWDESYSPETFETSDIINMVALQLDQLAFAVDQPSAVPPATRFNYSSGDSMLLSGVLEQATGMSAGEYARSRLLDPIGIDRFEWWQDVAGHTLTYCCVDTTSRDFARFGLLYLRDGNWNGQQVVPSAWVQDSIHDTAATFPGYGYQWWLNQGGGALPPYYSAAGHDGQYIHVFPSLDLVVVRNGFYGKSPCPPIADPSLLTYYPPQGLVPGKGTVGPDSWSQQEFLTPIVESLPGAAVVDVAPSGSPADGPVPSERFATTAEQAAADAAACPNLATPTTDPPPPGPPTAAVVTPGFTG